jgi:hypothetical protein
MDVKALNHDLIPVILQEIDTQLSRGVLPVHSGHLEHLLEEGGVIDYLLLMKRSGLIGGDLVTRGANNAPYRVTNIRLTYVGIKALRG